MPGRKGNVLDSTGKSLSSKKLQSSDLGIDRCTVCILVRGKRQPIRKTGRMDRNTSSATTAKGTGHSAHYLSKCTQCSAPLSLVHENRWSPLLQSISSQEARIRGMVDQLVTDEDPAITQSEQRSLHTSLFQQFGQRTGPVYKTSLATDISCEYVEDSDSSTGTGYMTGDDCTTSGESLSDILTDSESSSLSSDLPSSTQHSGCTIHDGISSNLERQGMLEPIVLAAHTSHSSMVNPVAKAPVDSSPLATCQRTNISAQADITSESSATTEEIPIKRVRFAKFREVKVVHGLGPHFGTGKHRAAYVDVRSVHSGFQSTRHRHRCCCGFRGKYCECFHRIDFVSSSYFGECYPCFFDLPDEALQLEPNESSNRVTFNDDSLSQDAAIPSSDMQALERLFEQSCDTPVVSSDESAWRSGMTADQPNPWAVWIPGVSPSHDRRWNLAHIRPGQLYFVDILTLEHPTVGGYQLILFGYDLKTQGYRVIPIRNKKLVGHAAHELIAREGLRKRPYQCTVMADGCGSMQLVKEAVIEDGLNYFPIPRNEPEGNPAEGVTNDFRERVYATLASAMHIDGPIDERHLILAAQYVCHVRERSPIGPSGDDFNPWRINTGQPSSMGHVVPFGTGGYAFIPKPLRKARGQPKYLRREPVICLGFLDMYSKVWKCMTRHGSTIHTRSVTWDFDTPLGLFPPDTNIRSKQSTELRDLEMDILARDLRRRGEVLSKQLTALSDPNAIIYRNDSKLAVKDPAAHIRDRLDRIHGLSINTAIGIIVTDRNGKQRPYGMRDLSYDYEHKWITVSSTDASSTQPYSAAEEARNGVQRDGNLKSSRRDRQRKGSPASKGLSFNLFLDQQTSYDGENTRRQKHFLIRQYEDAIMAGKVNPHLILQISQAIAMVVCKDLNWNKFLGSKDDAEVRKAYITEMTTLLHPETGILRELTQADGEEYEEATTKGRATPGRLILTVKRSGTFKCRFVVRGDLEDHEALDGPDYNYYANVVELGTLRNAFFKPGRWYDTISTCDISCAYTQADRFSEDEPKRYLKLWDPVLRKIRYFRQLGNLYGSKASGKRWQDTFFRWLNSSDDGLQFEQGVNEPCAFWDAGRNLLVLTYTDDVMALGPDKHVRDFMAKLHRRFECKPEEYLSEDHPIDFIGMDLCKDSQCLYISMQRYIQRMITVLDIDVDVSYPNVPISSPIDTSTRPLNQDERSWLLQCLGCLGWVSITSRLDLRYTHSRISQHLGSPTISALKAAKHAALYAYSTSDLCIRQPKSVVECSWRVYSDSDHAGNAEIQNKRKSQCSFIVFNGEAPITWGSKASSVQLEDNYLHSIAPSAHPSITDMHADLSSAAAEIYSAAISCYELLHVSYVCRESGIDLQTPVPLMIDNSTCIAFALNNVKRSKLKHVDLSQQWVITLRDAGLVTPTYCSSSNNEQLADIGTKILPAVTFISLREQLLYDMPTPGR